MEDGRFDALSRRVGEMAPPLPRRGVLRLLAGVALAGALGLAGDAAAKQDANNERKKGNNKNKNGSKQCKEDGQKCQRSKDCCDSKCEGGRCGSSGRCGAKVRFNNRWGEFGSGNGKFRTPWALAIDRNNNVYVTDSGNNRVQVFSASGSFIREWGESGSGSEDFEEPRGIGVNVESGSRFRVFVSDPDQSNASRRLRKFSTSGDFQDSLERNGLSRPRGIAIDADNNVWVVDSSSTGKIFLFDRGGDFIASWTPGGNGELSSPQGIAVFEDKDDDSTYVYVTSTGNNRVIRFKYTGNSSSGLKFIKSAGAQGSGSNSFNNPTGIAVDKCGNVWVADRINDRIQQLDKSLAFKSRVTASFDRPTDVAISPNGKSLYVADSENDRIQRFDLES